EGSAITMTYRVRGSEDAQLDKVAPAVDKVLGEQMQRLAAYIDASAPPKTGKLEERFIESAGARLRFVEAGRGEPVILLHDAGASIETQWLDTGLMAAVARGFRAIALEARDPGDVTHLMDQLGLARAHVVGYGRGAEMAAKLAVTSPQRLQTLTLAGATSLRSSAPAEELRGLAVSDEEMVALPVPTLGIVGMQDPAVRDFVELKRVMPRLVRMIALEDATHATAPASRDFPLALTYFLRYHPMPKQVSASGVH
ncbi:MAG TPA: alpha/beta hydrolase, partial [Usitatibacter sp.]|nr:alpha/beta hydrolase [Usitatibacter sp.]